MKTFGNLREALKNPYKGMDKKDLKRKLDSFESQLADLIKKSKGRSVRRIEPEIRDMETKVQYVRQALGIKKKGGKDVSEGRYTSNDGGAFDGLRIAKYLSDKDGNARWSRVPYGTSDSYLKTAMDMLKKDPKKARAILSKPTPRSGSL